MQDTLLRQWNILRLVPRAPRKVDGATLEARLRDQGIDVHRRTIQRDLQSLSEVFPLVSDESGKPFGWSWAQDAELVELPGMSAHTALTFHLVEAHLGQALPTSTLRHLEPHFRNAAAVLKRIRSAGFRSWASRLRVLPKAQPLVPPTVDAAVMASVYDALLTERKLTAQYQGRSDEGAKEVELNPLGLVLRDGAVYLVCTYWDYDDVRHLPLQRFRQAVVSAAKRRTPKGFDLDEYIESGELGFQVGKKPVRLVARVHPEVARTLEETPLSEEQVLRAESDGWSKVTAEVADTLMLRGWLMSYGPRLEVLRPAQLRRQVGELLTEAAGLYEREGAT